MLQDARCVLISKPNIRRLLCVVVSNLVVLLVDLMENLVVVAALLVALNVFALGLECEMS